MTAGELLASLRGRAVLVVGDVMLDEYIHGSATRISPEAPVMVIRKERHSHVPGGAANVAMNISALGGKASLLGLIGEDEGGKALKEGLDRLGLSESGLLVDQTRPTTRKTRVLAENAHQVVRIDEESTAALPAKLAEELLARLSGSLGAVDAILLSDYQKGMLTGDVISRIVAMTAKAGKPVLGNAKPGSMPSYRGATLVSLNRMETCGALGLDSLPVERAAEAATRLVEVFGVEHAVVTLGKDGMVGAGNTLAKPVHVPAMPVEVADVAGAGDTVIATIALGLAGGASLESSLRLAALTSSAVVRHVGVAIPNAADLAQIGSRELA